MPLVTMKCRDRWFPTDSSDLAYKLGEALPVLLTWKGHELYLDDGTPPEAVQVDFEKFDRLSINIPDIWILIVFTEDADRLSHYQRTEVRDKIVARIVGFMKYPASSIGQLAVSGELKSKSRPAMAIDIFWGPGHGCMLDQNGSTTLEW
jgi:hypothetical protein